MKRIAIVLLLIGGCTSSGGEIELAAGQSTYAEFDSDGNLIIQGDGTADFDVTASGNETDGWQLTIKTTTVRETISGAAQIDADRNATTRRLLDSIDNAVNRVPIPGSQPDPEPEP